MTEKEVPNRASADAGESAADKAIRDALASVDRLERERSDVTFDGDADLDSASEVVEILEPGDDIPPSGDVARAAPAHKKTADQLMLETLLKSKGELQDVLGQTQKEAKDMFDRLTRVSADFENYKKRVGREKDDAIKFGNEKAFKEVIPVVDNLRRALLAAPTDEAAKLFVDGVRLVSKQLEDALARFGVAGFDSYGQPFDPVRHEAVGSRADATVPSQHVCEEYQRGFMLHDRLLRPALVIVSAGPEN
jgi:molecular chaperone GrpE